MLDKYINQPKIKQIAEAPVQKISDILYVKRGDLYTVFDTNGFKAKQGYHLILSELEKRNKNVGVVTAGSRYSPQIYIVSNITHHLNIPCRVHTSINNKVSSEVYEASKFAKIIGHAWVRKTYLESKAKEDAEQRGWIHIPFGMGSHKAVHIIEPEVLNIPNQIKTIIISLGSGMNCAGLINGLERFANSENTFKQMEVIGVQNKDNNPITNIQKFSINPSRVTSYVHQTEYSTTINHNIKGIELDPYYEAKAWDWYIKNMRDVEHPILFWIIGKRTNFGMKEITSDFYSETYGNLAPYQERFLRGD